MFTMVTLVIASTIADVTINAVALAGIVFLFGLIPTVGAMLGAVAVLLFTVVVSPGFWALFMLVFFVVYQQIENATIQPYIQSRGSELTPLLVFIAAVMGIGLNGILGRVCRYTYRGLHQDYNRRLVDAKRTRKSYATQTQALEEKNRLGYFAFSNKQI